LRFPFAGTLFLLPDRLVVYAASPASALARFRGGARTRPSSSLSSGVAMSDLPKTPEKTLAKRRTERTKRLDELQATFHAYAERVTEMSKRTHGGDAMVFAAAAENWLRRAIATKMRGISNNLDAKIFENYGPLSSFAAKIDVAFAMGIVTEAIRHDLRIVKDVRNEFAHAKRFVDFHSTEIQHEMKKFPGFDPTTPDPHKFYFERVNQANRYLGFVVSRTTEKKPQSDEPAP
jgi:hypothetical protein